MALAIAAAHLDEILALRHAVLRPGRPLDDARFPGDDQAHTRHWAARSGGRVVGVATLLVLPMPDPFPLPRPRLQLRGMAVHEDSRCRGVGTALLDAIHREVHEPVWCNARERAVSLYARAGYSPWGEPFAIEGIGFHRRMMRAPTTAEAPAG